MRTQPTSPRLSWWLVPIGCQETSPTKINEWFVQQEPNVLYSSSPITLIGLISSVVGLITGALGLSKENKTLTWSGLLLGGGGLILAAVGKVMSHELIYTLINNSQDTKKISRKGDLVPKTNKVHEQVKEEKDAIGEDIINKPDELEKLLDSLTSRDKDKLLSIIAEFVFSKKYEHLGEVEKRLEGILQKTANNKTIDELGEYLKSESKYLRLWAMVGLLSNTEKINDINTLIINNLAPLTYRQNIMDTLVACTNLSTKRYNDISKRAFKIIKSLSQIGDIFYLDTIRALSRVPNNIKVEN